ncbi:hypothetical protein GGTG_10414 [Gaeumannomyces tritici R3-111a-1]|uniref:Uncharacterized protein n=1 Tax=Gaeumannomyces tritici (strain R3-111a-1) TaxID=644352 RepID=J3PA88_GAET3|nr:hypothetical protein GGTG_10414 [Gaeumannomyces tritici R3-111a-1]EJT71154.1 hypothetical protein GGTG_10414 [Gaeumannomyces tritici R3-111a-1]
MGSHKFHMLRKLVSPAKHQQLQEDPSDELAMVGRSEVPVCLAADRPPAHLLKSLHSRDAPPTTSSSRHKRPPPLTPPRSPPRSAAGASTANPASGSRSGSGSGSGSPVAAAPPDSPMSGYRRSPSIAETPTPLVEAEGSDGTLPSLTASSSAASSLAGRPSSDDEVDVRGGVALPPPEAGAKEVPSAGHPVRVAES